MWFFIVISIVLSVIICYALAIAASKADKISQSIMENRTMKKSVQISAENKEIEKD